MKTLVAICAAMAATIVILLVLLIGAEHRTVTVQPPCYVRVPGFSLPAGAHWC